MAVNLYDALAGSFVVVNLGSAGDFDYDLPESLLQTVTLIEIDGAKNASESSERYFRKHTIYDVVAGSNAPGIFTVRNFKPCSSFYAPRPEMIKEYGLEKFYEARSSQTVSPTTLPEILDRLKIGSVDLLKTDLEGLDFEILKSCDPLLSGVLAIKSELRFQPFYQGEPYFHEVVQYLHHRDFELIGLKPEYWKPVTRNRKNHRDGRIVFADVFFIKKPGLVMDLPDNVRAISAAKQILIASMSGKKSHAEWLLGLYGNILPKEWISVLSPATLPHDDRIFGAILKRLIFFLRSFPKKVGKLKNHQSQDRAFDFSHISSGD